MNNALSGAIMKQNKSLILLSIMFLLVFCTGCQREQTKIEHIMTESTAQMSSATTVNNESTDYSTPVNTGSTLNQVRQMIGLPHWSPLFNSQAPFSVAILDSGVFPHQDLIGTTNRIVAFKDLVNQIENPYDDNGHGTAVAGIIAGDGYQSGGVDAGLAPFVNLVCVKTLDYACRGYAQTLIDGIYWVIEHKEQYNIKILNISIGVPTESSLYRDVAQAAKQAFEAGILVVAAVGNNGTAKSIVQAPANSANVIAVGTVEKNAYSGQYEIPSFSSVGITASGIKKPDIYAPGSDVISLKSDIYYKGKGEINQKISYGIPLSGTSISCAVISGAAAVMIQQYPSMDLNQIKEVIEKNSILLETNESMEKSKMFFFNGGEYER